MGIAQLKSDMQGAPLSKKVGLALVRRSFLPRAIGLGVGFFCVAAVLREQGAALWLWAVLVAHCYLWPLLALRLAQRAEAPLRVERRQVLLDSLMGGFWIATIQFNVLPTVMMLSMLAMNNTAAGGARMVGLGLGAQVVGMGLAVLLFGFGWQPLTSQTVIYACIPMLVVHPLTIGLVLYQLAVQLGRSKRALRHLSRTDSLTQLFNRGYWKECLGQEFERCRQMAVPACLVLIDVDHFKHANDRHGHVAGDSVLREVGECISRNLRGADTAGRYGGDEFCVLLPRATPAQAYEVLERVRAAVSALRFVEAEDLQVSLSIGIAGYSQALADTTAWLNAADAALYQAKNQGRNCIVLADTPPAEALVAQPG